MAKKRTRKPNFSKMTIDELQAVYDPDLPVQIFFYWQGEMLERKDPLPEPQNVCQTYLLALKNHFIKC